MRQSVRVSRRSAKRTEFRQEHLEGVAMVKLGARVLGVMRAREATENCPQQFRQIEFELPRSSFQAVRLDA